MLKKTKLRALSPGQWAQVHVPDYEDWRDEPTASPGDEVDVCIIPLRRPRYGYPDYFGWHYWVAWKSPSSEDLPNAADRSELICFRARAVLGRRLRLRL
jgi:hypothetical protein